MKPVPMIAVMIAVLAAIGGIGYMATRDTKKEVLINSTSPTNQDTVEADGTIVSPDGTMVKLDGTMVKPDGTMIKPDGTMIGPDGQLINDNTNSTTTNTNTSPTNTNTTTSSAGPAKYVSYSSTALATAQAVPQGDTVLYFHANWCPICQVLDPDITKNISQLPVGVTILKVDYDKETALKKKYGVTYQHTFVQVDPNGEKLKLWSGSSDALAIRDEIL